MRLLTPEEASVVLPVPCMGVLTKRLSVTYPTSSASGRGSVVLLVPLVYSTPGAGLQVLRDQWDGCVVPVLLDETWWPSNPLLWGSASYEVLLGAALRASFVEAGWGPI